jgi:hypothetical protein
LLDQRWPQPQPLSQQVLQLLQVCWQHEVWQQLVSQPQWLNLLNQRWPQPELQQSLQVLQVLQVLQLEQVSQQPQEFRWNRPLILFHIR